VKSQVFLLETISNLHVGDLGNSLSIVDKCVQRDALTQYPTVHATSLKGALRNAAKTDMTFFSTDSNEAEGMIRYVFGGSTTDSFQGHYRFASAHALFYPVRSSNRPYYLATCPAMIQDACRQLALAGHTQVRDALLALRRELQEPEQGCILEQGKSQTGNARVAHLALSARSGGQALANVLALLEGETALVLLSDQEMQQVIEDLPVIARNQLDNGISANLWYEEFVPRRTVFLTLLMMAEEKQKFTEFLTNKIHQIGANATVGYGLCSFRLLPEGG
jgi:CRISPR-associated protein Cmr4